MKLKTWRIENLAGDKIRITAEWKNKMRRPAGVYIVETVLDPGDDAHSKALTEGEKAKVLDTLSGLATLAWSLGWRPPGLIGAVATAVMDHSVTEG